MNPYRPHGSSVSGREQPWQEVLRRAAIAVQERGVGVWEADAHGRLHLLAASAPGQLEPRAADELEATLRELGELPPAGPKWHRWVASPLKRGRWCVARVSDETPRPPPAGVERRGRERMTLELAGLCIGLIDQEAASPAPARDAPLSPLLDHLPAALWTTDADLRVTSRSGGSRILPQRVVGASLVELYDRGDVSADSLNAHRQALAGESLSYQIQLADHWYDARVQPLRDEAGAVVGAVGLAVDVTDREQAFAQLRSSQMELEDFVQHAPVGIRWTAPDGTILRANEAELDMLGYRRAEYEGHNTAEFFVDRGVATGGLDRLRGGETVRNLEVRMRHRDGSVRHGLLSANPRFDGNRFLYARVITRDITERARAEEVVAQFKAMVESAEDAVIGKTLEGTITSWNSAASRLYGYAAEEVLGKPITLLAAPDHADEMAEILERVGRGEHTEHFETVRMRKDGSLVDVSVTVSPIVDEQGRPTGATSIARDVTDRKRAERQLLHEALHDTLTDLPNRAYFVERVVEALARTRRDGNYRFAVLFLDLDDFKLVNDTFGHAAGDHFLKEVAGRLHACVRPGDLVARLGGDEFTLLLEEITGVGDVERAARRILDALAVPIALEGQELPVRASIGGALSDPGYAHPGDLLHDADLAMYHAKQEGGSRFQVFHAAMRIAVQARLGMEADLRQALERQEFRLAFQPIVELATGRVHGFEALLRWHHHDRGVVPPLEFIPLAEQTGLILPIGHWVLQEACQSARRWQDAFPAAAPLRISVNLSPKQLGHHPIVEDVRMILQQAGLPPSCLMLEISETILMDNAEASMAPLHRLRGMGVELYADDFGAGHSSLGRLQGLPLHGIKIDHSFVHRMGGRRRDLASLRTIVELAGTLGLSVIAEGVDTVAQRERLIAFGCDLGQGYLFGKPLDAARVDTVLAQSLASGRQTA